MSIYHGWLSTAINKEKDSVFYFYLPKDLFVGRTTRGRARLGLGKVENIFKKSIFFNAYPKMEFKKKDKIERNHNLIIPHKFYMENSLPPLCFDIACVVNMESVSLFQRQHLKLSLKRMSSGGK